MFHHEKLQVYGRALDFSARVSAFALAWDKKHAVVDHITRASESIVLNLAEAARQLPSSGRLRTIDYSIGSSLECAACLDVAAIKALLTRPHSYQEKQTLCEITRMLIGLRKAWAEMRFPGATILIQAKSRARQIVPPREPSGLSYWFEFYRVVHLTAARKRTLRQSDSAN